MGEALKKKEDDLKVRIEAHEKKIEADRLAELEKRLKEELDKIAAKLDEQAEKTKTQHAEEAAKAANAKAKKEAIKEEDAKSKAEQATKREEALKKAEDDLKVRMEAHEKKIEADRLAELKKRLKEEADKLAAKLEEQAEKTKTRKAEEAAKAKAKEEGIKEEDAKSKAEQATKREEALKKKEEEEKEKVRIEAHEKKIEAESGPGPTGGCSEIICINGNCENSKCICQSGWTGEACDAEDEIVKKYATTTPAVSVPATAPTPAPITAPTTGPSGSGSSGPSGSGSSDASGAGSSGASGAGSSGASGAGGTATLAPVPQPPGTVRACTPQTCENGDCINNDNECKCHTGYKGAKCDEIICSHDMSNWNEDAPQGQCVYSTEGDEGHCVCFPGWNGTQCENPLDEAKSGGACDKDCGGQCLDLFPTMCKINWQFFTDSHENLDAETSELKPTLEQLHIDETDWTVKIQDEKSESIGIKKGRKCYINCVAQCLTSCQKDLQGKDDIQRNNTQKSPLVLTLDMTGHISKDTRNDELHQKDALAVNKTRVITNMMVQNESAKIAIQGEQEKQGNTEDTENTATSAPTHRRQNVQLRQKAIKAKIIDLHGLENNSKGSGVLGWLGSWFTSKSKK